MKTILSTLLIVLCSLSLFAQDSEKIKATLLLKAAQFQNELLVLANGTDGGDSKRRLAEKYLDNQINNEASIDYIFQKNATTLVKEKYKERHFLLNTDTKYFKVEPLLLGEARIVETQEKSKNLTLSKVRIWHLADYYFSAEKRTTYLIRYDLQMNVENIKDDFDETAFNIEVVNVQFYKKEVALDKEARNTLKENKQIYENQVVSFLQSNAEILLESPKFDTVKDTADVYIIQTDENLVQLSGHLKNVYSTLLIDGKPVNVQSDGRFDYTLPLGLEKSTGRIITLQITENQLTIQKEIWVHYGEMRGQEMSSNPTVNMSTPPKYYALLIGVKDYSDSTMDLRFPIEDAEKLKNTLVQYYTFQEENITFLKNPTRSELIGTLDALTKNINEQSKNGKDANINLLIFYAGHGYLDTDLQRGFWFPKDANAVGEGNRKNWLSNNDLRDYIRAIKTQHTLLVIDACFAGTLLISDEELRNREQRREAMPRDIRNIYKEKSRKAMTSGALTTVPDRSAFLEYLVSSLVSFAKDHKKRRYFDAASLFYNFKPKVLQRALTAPRDTYQNPIYGAIVDTGDNLGDFVFTIK